MSSQLAAPRFPPGLPIPLHLQTDFAVLYLPSTAAHTMPVLETAIVWLLLQTNETWVCAYKITVAI